MSWSEVPLRRIFRIINGGTPKSNEEYWNGDVPWATPVDIGMSDGGYLTVTQRNLTEEGVLSGSRTVPGESLVLSTRAPIGYVAQVRERMAFNQGCRGLIPIIPTDNRYFRYHLLALREKLMALGAGSTFMELSSDALASVSVTLPPLDEQRRIADFLDAETARIDRLAGKQLRMIEVIEERRVAVTSHLVYGRDCDGEKTKTPIEPIGAIPSTWRVMRNKTFMREVMDLSDTGDEELLSVSHLTGVTPRSEKDVNMFLAESMVGYKRCQPGDLVINTLWAWMGALGVSRYSGILSPAYGIYRLTSEVMDGQYLDFLVRTPEYVTEMTRFSKGVWTSRLRLYPESFLALSVPVPPRSKQSQIVKQIISETADQERLKSKLESFARTLTERRQALINAAVTGQFDVTTASGRSLPGGAAV